MNPHIGYLAQGTYYALTISPPYRLSDSDIPESSKQFVSQRGLFMHDRANIIRILNKCSESYFIWPEITLDGRLHYHGIVEIFNLVAWKAYCCRWIRRDLGYFCIKPPGKLNEKWLQYCTKEFTETSKVLSISGCITYEPTPPKKIEVVPPPAVKKPTHPRTWKTIFDYCPELGKAPCIPLDAVPDPPPCRNYSGLTFHENSFLYGEKHAFEPSEAELPPGGPSAGTGRSQETI